MNWLYLLFCYKEVVILYIFLVHSGSFLFFFHQEPQIEKESGAEGEEDIGDSQEPFWTIL